MLEADSVPRAKILARRVVMGIEMGKLSCRVQAGVAAVLCLMMTATSVPAWGEAAAVAGAAAKKHPRVVVQTQLGDLVGDERILQALNRLTWGPRPGDLEQVRAMGMDKWIDEQLNPKDLDDSAVDNVMGNFPALRLSPAQMVMHFPDNNIAKDAASGKIAMPSDPYLYAVYRNAIARYRHQQEKKAAASAAAANVMAGPTTAGTPAGAGAAGNNAAMNAMAAEVMGGGVSATPNQQAGMVAANVGPSPDIMTTEAKIAADLAATQVLNLPPQERLMRLIEMEPDELVDFRNRLSGPERLELGKGMSPQQRESLAALDNPVVLVGAELMQAKLLRSIETSHQLEDVMTDFWLNHFNVYIKKGQPEPYYIASYEQDVLRPHALGKFEDLLVATAKSPAMLFYLDNWSSSGPDSMQVQKAKRVAEFSGNPQAKAAADRGLNENYARELMELHTLGVDGGYTQQDVTQVARVFTGWTIDKPQMGGGYVFDEKRHEPGPKVVLGKTINYGGEREGLEVLHILATSPATAHHVSYEIAQRFVADEPPAALVEQMTATWLETDGDIRAVLKTMLSSPEFWSSSVYRKKVKTPLEYVVSAVRATEMPGTAPGANVGTVLPLVVALDKLEMPLFGQQPPNGYAMTADHWVSTSALLNRMNFALYLASGRMPGLQTDWSGMIAKSVAAPEQLAELDAPKKNGSSSAQAPVVFDASEWQPSDKEQRLEMLLLGSAASHQTHDAVMEQIVNQPTMDANALERQFAVRRNPAQAEALVGMIGNVSDAKPMSAEEKQLAMMAGLLLGSPDFQRR